MFKNSYENIRWFNFVIQEIFIYLFKHTEEIEVNKFMISKFHCIFKYLHNVAEKKVILLRFTFKITSLFEHSVMKIL